MIKGIAKEITKDLPADNIVSLVEAEYERCKYCLAEFEAVRDKLPKGYLHTITGFGKDLHYHYLPPSSSEELGTLTYLDESQQDLIDALISKKKLSVDISKAYDYLSLFPTFLNDYLPFREYAEVLEQLIEDSFFFMVLQRRLAPHKVRYSRTKKWGKPRFPFRL